MWDSADQRVAAAEKFNKGDTIVDLGRSFALDKAFQKHIMVTAAHLETVQNVWHNHLASTRTKTHFTTLTKGKGLHLSQNGSLYIL